MRIRNGIRIVRWTDNPEKYLTPEELAHKAKQREELFQRLKDEHCFWSYDQSSLKEISDETLIEMVMQHLDLKEINVLFQLFSYEKIKKVWIERLVTQGDYLFSMNQFFAFYYFKAKRPGAYVRAMATRQLNKISDL